MPRNKNGLLIFSKTPDPGLVKTRLKPILNDEQAAKLSATLLNHTVSIASFLPNLNIECHILGNLQHACLQNYLGLPNLSLHQQRGSHLGTRMSRAVENAFLYYKHVVIVGSDCAVITPQYIENAFFQLQHSSDVVIGPALDGGYILLGLNFAYLKIFENIPWSTAAVLSETQQRLHSDKIKWIELPTLWDIDRADDLEKFRGWYLANIDEIKLMPYSHQHHEIFQYCEV